MEGHALGLDFSFLITKELPPSWGVTGSWDMPHLTSQHHQLQGLRCQVDVTPPFGSMGPV